MVSAFYSLKNIRTPVLAALANLLVCVPLAWWLSSGPMEYRGIALAASVSSIVQVVLLMALMGSQVKLFDFRGLLRSILRCLCCAALMGTALWPAAAWLEGGEHGKLMLGVFVFGVIFAAAGLYFLLCRIAGMEEGAMLLRGLRRKRS